MNMPTTKKPRITWKRQKYSSGTCSADPGHDLRVDGVDVGAVRPHSELNGSTVGWFWYCVTVESLGTSYTNTSNVRLNTPEEAKYQCEAYVRAAIDAKSNSVKSAAVYTERLSRAAK